MAFDLQRFATHMGLSRLSRGGCLPGSKFDPDGMVYSGSRVLRIGFWRFEPQVEFEGAEKKVRS